MPLPRVLVAAAAAVEMETRIYQPLNGLPIRIADGGAEGSVGGDAQAGIESRLEDQLARSGPRSSSPSRREFPLALALLTIKAVFLILLSL